MRSGLETSVSDSFTEERAALASVLASATFSRSPNLAKILTFLCEAHFAGIADSIKEYSIGMQALGRGADFDPRVSSVVRVEVSRLRKRLAQYYATEGAADPIRIVLPESGYKPQFVDQTAVSAVSPPHLHTHAEAAEEREPVPSELASGSGSKAIVGPGHLTYLTVVVLALIVGVYVVERLSRGMPTRSNVSAGAAAVPEGRDILIHAGAQTSTYIDRLGRTWGMDRYFSGGSTFNRPVRVFGSIDSSLYQSGREGTFAYAIPVPNGLYELHLHFAETFWDYEIAESDASGTRMFDVKLNGKPLLSSFDIVSDAEGSRMADERVFAGVSPASDGLVHLDFTGKVSAALLNGIELRPASTPLMRPVRIMAGGDSYVDHRGDFWGPDRYFLGGRLLKHVGSTAGTDDPGLYIGEHWGHFTYRIPVAAGTYTVRLRFAERHYGQLNLGGGTGSRLFNVYCNGVALLRNLDIFQEARGENRALDKIFRGVSPNPQGKIVLTFEPGNTYATVNAIEIVPEHG